jgi:hypothetical protein
MIVCSNNIYEYKGWIIEFHHFCGPWPLTKDFTPKKRAGKVFWSIWEEFSKLPTKEQIGYIKHTGGCRKL